MNFAQRYVSKLSSLGASPDRVAKAVVHSLTHPRPTPRRVVGIDANIVGAALHILPPRMIYRLTALPKVGSARQNTAPP